ncbi:M1 family metallopeptidase [Neptunicella sp. SCSIO 80796]|uniref:M1 family metallopeptidase n=1 Tax=Neptunicella plasticusilytica TaxID=3117012 RepID=UPI003A4DF1A2
MNKYFRLIALSLFITGCTSTDVVLKTSPYTMKSGGEVPLLQQGLQVKHADLKFEVFPANKRISGSTTLTLHSDTTRTAIAVDLDQVFTISSISINGTELAKDAYRNDLGLLSMQTPAPVQGDFSVSINYAGSPREAVKAPWDGGFVWSKTPSGADWIATADQGEGCDLFWPCIDHPFGEPLSADIRITVPKNLKAVTNGVFIDETSQGETNTFHWQTRSVHNTYGIALNIAPYEKIQQTYHSIYGNEFDVVYYHLPETTEKAKILFAEIPPMLDFFERMIGPFPFSQEKAGFVETPHLGMEHQTINAYGNEYKKDAYGFDWLMQHEFAHEWFANQLTAANSDHMWLQEGFGAYMQPLFTQYLHGDMAYKARLFEQRKALDNQFPMVSNKSLEVEQVFNKDIGPGGDVYTKGSLMLHSLRELMGDEAFFKAVRIMTYGTDNPQPGHLTPRLGTSDEFIQIVNQVTGKDLTWFFNVYLFQAKLPKLEVERTDKQIILQWRTENNVAFPMPVEVSINNQLHVLDLSQPQSLPVSPKDVVIVDPDSKVLRYDQAIADYQAFKQAQEQNK